MKKLGFGRKKDDGSANSSRDNLSVNKKSGSQRDGGANPYAGDAAANDPYVNNNNSAPPPYSGGGSNGAGNGFRDEKSGVPPGGYGGAGGVNGNRFGAPPGGDNRFGASPAPGVGNRFGASPAPGGGNRFGASPAPGGDNRFGASPGPGGDDRFGAKPQQDRFGAGSYGNAGGFGQDRFGEPGPQNGPQGGSRYGSSGYGNFGDSNPPVNSAARNELFAGARPNNGPGTGSPLGGGPKPGSDWESGRGDNYGAGNNYGAYESRQLTAEEQEEEDINATKQEIRFLKQQDVSSTRNALRLAAQAEETGRQTLERLGAQGEAIHNTERNLDLASNQNKLAAEKARELKTLNRSMFAVHMANPFTSSKRIKEREEQVLDDARRDREQRDATRSAAWGNANRQDQFGRELNKLGGVQQKSKASLAERSKYQFEADSEDEAMEDEIDNNLDLLHGAAKRLNHVAGAMGREVDIQNGHLGRIGGKVDKVDDEIALNRSRLDRIK